jgi:hypothetical protein
MLTTKTLNSSFIGSVSTATMRTVDLVCTFMKFLEEIDENRHDKIVGSWSIVGYRMDKVPFKNIKGETMFFHDLEPKDSENHPFWSTKNSTIMLDELFDIMNEYAPDGTCFGAHIGDGADYGFWPIEEE